MARKPKEQPIAPPVQESNIHLELTNEMYRTFDFFNSHFCEGKLPRPVVSIAASGKSKMLGCFTNNTWKNVTENKIIHEIVISAESFKMPIYEILNTMLHEMAHLKNFEDNDHKVVDCTPQQRHNKIFKATAEFFGLNVTSSKRFGSAHTSNGAKANEAIELLNPKEELYTIYRDNFQEQKDKKKYVSKLKPVMVDEDTKNAIEEGAASLGMTQKEFARQAVSIMKDLQKNTALVASVIFENRKKYKDSSEIEAVIIDGVNPPLPELVIVEEGSEEAEG